MMMANNTTAHTLTLLSCDDPEGWTPSHVLIPLLHILICVLGLLGNIVVIYIVWRDRSKWRTLDLYIVSLAVADFIFLVNLPLWATYEAMGNHWVFGRALCKLSNFMWLVNMYASIFSLTCLSLHRYLTIVRSRANLQLCTRSIKTLLVFVWLLAGLLSIPELVFNNTFQEDNRTRCSMDFRVVVDGRSKLQCDATLDLMNSVVGLVVPLLAVMVCYGCIAYTLARHFHGEAREARRMRRLLKIICLLVLVFAVCWTPYHVATLLFSLSRLLGNGDAALSCSVHGAAYPYIECLAYANSCMNPLLYAFCDPFFRSQCLTLVHLRKTPVSGSSSTKDGEERPIVGVGLPFSGSTSNGEEKKVQVRPISRSDNHGTTGEGTGHQVAEASDTDVNS
ncbi:apelin receptor B-like [Engraulis encrasicolus]|uniref:apelin receptor B-like n=1 Tax=Engraulis encrasicolus TaxID=184585 RepID=UPI002FCED550